MEDTEGVAEWDGERSTDPPEIVRLHHTVGICQPSDLDVYFESRMWYLHEMGSQMCFENWFPDWAEARTSLKKA